ncbi:MAG: CPBP family intramembrane glutamic endopeptidase [Planctomycetota bacterium]|jgi:hypothetical protein
MSAKKRTNKSQLFNFVEDSYLERTSRPLYALVFLLPFIIIYELGTIFINTNILRQYWQGRVVAFAWIQRAMESLGFTDKLGWLVTPLAVVIILLALQLTSKKRWYLCFGDLIPMLIECILLAIPLIVLSLFLSGSGQQQGVVAPQASSGVVEITVCSSVPSGQSVASDSAVIKLLANIVTGIGAGIYEELVFRLILICLLMMLFQDFLRVEHSSSIVLSVLLSAALFSAYHHVDFFTGQLYQGTSFAWNEFAFRTLAGVYFAVLFAVRGFGITAGTHAFYDVIATCINAFFFVD